MDWKSLRGINEATRIVHILDETHTRCGEEPLHGLEENREAEGEKEDTVDQGSEDLGAVPSIRIAGVGVGLACELSNREWVCVEAGGHAETYPDGVQCDNQTEDITVRVLVRKS